MKKLTTILATAILVVFLTVNAFAWTDMIMGQPDLKAGKDNGIFFWLDKDGFHIRVTSPEKTVFTGSMVAPEKVDVGKLNNLKNGDFVKKYAGPSYISAGEFKTWKVFYESLKDHKTESWKRVWHLLPNDTKNVFESVKKGKKLDKEGVAKIIDGVNNIIQKQNLYEANAFKGVTLSPEAEGYIKKGASKLDEEEVQRLNRLLIEAISSNTITPSTKEIVKFQFTVNKDIKGFDFITKSPYLDFTPCKMNGKLVKKQFFKSGKKKQDLEHTPFRIYDLGNPNTKMPFPH